MIYVVLVLALAMACVVGVQLLYMMFLQHVIHHDKRRLEETGRRLKRTALELDQASLELKQTQAQLEEALARRDDAWPEIIDG